MRSRHPGQARRRIAVVVDAHDLAFGHIMHRRKSAEERLDFFMVATRWTGEPRVAEPHRCSGLTWARPETLPPDVVPYVRHGIAETIAGHAYSEFGWDPSPRP